jgi:hypothetical protein
MPVVGIYTRNFPALSGAVEDANIIPIAISGDNITYRTTVSGIVTDARVTSKLLTGLSITGSAVLATDTILQAFGKVQNQVNDRVPYTGATANVNLGTFDITTDIVNLNQLKAVGSGGLNIYSNSGTHIALMGGGGGAGTTFYGGIIGTSASFLSSGSSDTVGITHSSGSGIALNITKDGNGEGLYINKTSGSGNAATIIGTLNATTLVKSGGTSAQFLKADGSVDANTYLTSLSGAVLTTTNQNVGGLKTFTDLTTFSGSAGHAIVAVATGVSSFGVSASSSGASGRGVYGITTHSSGAGIYGDAGSGGSGVLGANSAGGWGGNFTSVSGPAIAAASGSGTGGIFSSTSGDIAQFFGNGVQRVTIANSGALSGTSATFSLGIGIGAATATTGGIQFPATQVAIADANNLDDYEEGTFTPTATFTTPGTVSTASAVGVYTKIGNLVSVVFRISITKGTGSGNIILGGLPFTSTSTSPYQASCAISTDELIGTGVRFEALVANSATTITFLKVTDSTGNATNVTAADLSATTALRFQVNYQI